MPRRNDQPTVYVLLKDRKTGQYSSLTAYGETLDTAHAKVEQAFTDVASRKPRGLRRVRKPV